MSQSLTITAFDAFNNVATGYTGVKQLTFSGPGASTNPVTQPTVTDKDGTAVAFGTATSLTFSAGVAKVSGSSNGKMTLYKAESTSVGVTDQSISSSGSTSFAVTVSEAALSKFLLVLASPQVNTEPFVGTNVLTATDSFGNPITTFDAAADPVTITADAPLVGTITGLGSGGNNVLDRTSDFTLGVANLNGMVYTGLAQPTQGTFTANSNSGHTGTSNQVTTVEPGTATKLQISGSE